MPHFYNTRSNKKTMNAVKKLRTVRFNVDIVDKCDDGYTLRSKSKDTRVNYYPFYRNYHEKFSKELRYSRRSKPVRLHINYKDE